MVRRISWHHLNSHSLHSLTLVDLRPTLSCHLNSATTWLFSNSFYHNVETGCGAASGGLLYLELSRFLLRSFRASFIPGVSLFEELTVRPSLLFHADTNKQPVVPADFLACKFAIPCHPPPSSSILSQRRALKLSFFLKREKNNLKIAIAGFRN